MHKFLALISTIFLLLSLFGCSPQDTSNTLIDNQTGTSSGEKEPASTKEELIPTKEVSESNSLENQVQLEDKPYFWYLKPNMEHEIPYVNEDIKMLLVNADSFYVLPNLDNKIYLTFDEGYELGYTEQILDILKANKVKAAFFITGHYLQSQPELVKRMKAEDHLVCNHTFNHPNLAQVSPAELREEITSLENEFRKLTGSNMDKYLRPPGGNYSPTSLKLTQELGYKTVFWSLAFEDWNPKDQPGADFSYQYVTDHIHPGAVILLHAVSESNTQALDRIIKDLITQGYTFATLDDFKVNAKCTATSEKKIDADIAD